jgi:capsid protein
MQIRSGAIKIPAKVAALKTGKHQFFSHEWISPGWAWVDPEREINATIMEIDAGLNCRQDALAAHGRNMDSIDRKRRQDIEENADLGYSKSTSTRDPGTEKGASAPEPLLAKHAKEAPETVPDDGGDEDTA